MKKLTIDFGVEEFEINGGKILRFNPADLNVYNRLLDAQKKIIDIERRLEEGAEKLPPENTAEAAFELMAEADAEMKKLLQEIFGTENDFFDIFEGVNVMSVAANDERVITNFLAAIIPIIEEGAQRAARVRAKNAAGKVRANRGR